MRLVRLLALRHLRLRPLRTVLAVLAVAAGAAMVVSVFVVRSSAATSIERFGRSLSGPTELRVVGPVRQGGLEARVVEAVAATDGVAAAVPMVQTVSLAEVETAGGGITEHPVTVLGVDCRVELLLGDIGCTDSAVADLGDRPLAVGPRVGREARVRAQGTSVAVGDTPVLDSLAEIGDGRVVVFGLATAQRLYDRDGRLDVVYVDPAPGTDVDALRARIEDAIGAHNDVLDAAEGPPEVASSLEAALPMFTLIAVLGLGIGAMLVHNSAALTVEERRLDLAVIAAVGGGPRTVAAALLGESVLVGAVGGLLGAAAGVVVAGPIVGSLSSFTERRAGVPLDVHLTWPSLALAVVLGTVVSAGAAAFPVRRALRADVAAELSGRERRGEAAAPALARRAALWGGGVVAGVVAIEVGTRNGGLEPWQVPAAALGFAATALCLLMLGGNLSPLGLGPLQRVADRSAAGRLAVGNLRREPRRTGVMVVAVAAASTTAFLTASYLDGARQAIAENVLDELDGVVVSVVGAGGSSAGLDTGMSAELLAVLNDVPGAEPVARGGAGVLTGARSGELVWVSAQVDPWLGDDVVVGEIDRAAFLDGEAIVNVTLARDTGLRPGDDVRVAGPTGTVDLPIQAVVYGGGPSGRSVQIPWDVYERLYDVPPPRAVVVEPGAGTSIAALERAVAEHVDAAQADGRLPDTQVRVLGPDQVAAESVADVDAELAPFWTLQRGLLGVSFVAVSSTLLLVGVQRRRELAVLGAVGMEPGMLGRMVLIEAGLVGVLATALTASGGLVVLWALHRVGPLLIGWRVPLAPDWVALVVWGAVSTLVTLAAALWPARRAARTEIVPALQAE